MVRMERSCYPERTTTSLQRFHWHVELDGIDDAQSLKLDPHAIGLGPWKHHLEFDHRPVVDAIRMLMNHVDEVVARCQHVRPCPEILLESITRIEPEAQLRTISGNRLFRDRFHRHTHVRA